MINARNGLKTMKINVSTTQQRKPKKSSIIDITNLVKKDLEARARMGKKKYGQRLLPFDGRDTLIDAYQEACDLCCYLRKAIYEKENTYENH